MNEAPRVIESELEQSSDWETQRENGPVEAEQLLFNEGLPATFEEIKEASAEVLEQLMARSTALEVKVSYDEQGELINSNKYIARHLSVLREQARRCLEANKLAA